MNLLKYLAALVLTTCLVHGTPRTVNVSGGTNSAAIQATINLCNAVGDEIILPAGLYTFSTYLDNKNKSFWMHGDLNDTNAVILQEITVNRSTALCLLMLCTITNKTATNATDMMRISHLQITSSAASPISAGIGDIRIQQLRSPFFVMDHVFFKSYGGRPFDWENYSSTTNIQGGVVHGCLFQNTKDAPGNFFDTPGSTAANNGYLGFAYPVPWGSTNMPVFEQCIFSNNTQRAFFDGRGACYYIARDCTFYNSSFQNHEINSRKMPPRAHESYRNTFIGNSVAQGEAAHYLRAGTALIWSNNVTGNYGAMASLVNYVTLSHNATFWGFAFKGASSTNVWDLNDPTVYATGIVTSVSADKKSFTDSTANFSTNLVRKYMVINKGSGWAGMISSNTLTTIGAYDGINGTSQAILWTNGQPYQIGRVIKAFGQPGFGTCDLLTNGTDTVQATPTGWPHAADEPVHYWGNTIDGGHPQLTVGLYGETILTNRDFEATPLTGYIPLGGWAISDHPFYTFASGGVATVFPTIAAIADQTILQNSNTGPLTVTIGAGETNVANYVLTYTSSTTALVPNGAATNVVFGGSGSNRTVTVYPVTGQSGPTTIGITVTDELGHQAARAFVLNVSGVNTPPTITSIVNQTLLTSSSTGVLPFTVGDLETPPGSLVVTATTSDTNCIPSANITLGGSGANRNVTVLSGLVYGFSQITLSVSDGTTNATSSFFVNVIPPSPATKVNAKIARIGTITTP